MFRLRLFCNQPFRLEKSYKRYLQKGFQAPWRPRIALSSSTSPAKNNATPRRIRPLMEFLLVSL